VCRYICSGAFWFDLITAIPESIIERMLRESACAKTEAGTQERNNDLQIVQLLRPLRIFRVLRSAGLVQKLKSLENLLQFSAILKRMSIPEWLLVVVSTMARIFLVVHTCTCTFWLVKTVTTTPEEVERFLEKQGVSEATLADCYVISFYYVNTIFTTVGFGDVTPSNHEERLVTVLFMFIGTVVFAYLLGEVHEVLSDHLDHARARGKILNHTREFLAAYQVSFAHVLLTHTHSNTHTHTHTQTHTHTRGSPANSRNVCCVGLSSSTKSRPGWHGNREC
jgi:hypothetical protein